MAQKEINEKFFRKLVVDKKSEGKRLDLFLSENLPEVSRTKLQKLILTGHVLVDGNEAKPSEVVVGGSEIVLKDIPKKQLELEPAPVEFEILFEDEYLIVLNKPAGLVVHPGAGETGPTLVEGLLYYLKKKPAVGQGIRPGIVHRLDKDTTGVLVCAKTDEIHEALSQQFREKTNLREYVALLDGLMEQSDVSRESYLKRDPRSRLKFISVEVDDVRQSASTEEISKNLRFARSHFRKIQTYGQRLTLASIRLDTGRTHQIRVHSRDLGMPVVGDPLYNPGQLLPSRFGKDVVKLVKTVNRQLLHAKIFGFLHPKTGKKLAFEAPIPDDFSQVLRALGPFKDA